MPLAENDDDIARLSELDRAENRMLAVDDLFIRLLPDRRKDARLYLAKDRLWVFRARIVARREHDVGKLCREASHDGPLRSVAVAAAAEYGNDSLLRDLARRVQDVFDAVRRMRIVDNDGKFLPRPHEFKTSGHAVECFECGMDRLRRDVFRERRARRRHDVVDIEKSRDVHRERHRAEVFVHQREFRAILVYVYILCDEIAILLDRIRQMRTVGVREHDARGRIVEIGDCRLAVFSAFPRDEIK